MTFRTALGVAHAKTAVTSAALFVGLFSSLPVSAQEENVRVVEAGSLSLKIPDRWKEREVKRRRLSLVPNLAESMRYTQFSIRRTHHRVDDVELLAEFGAELVVFHYGSKGDGSTQAVVKAWIEQFALKRRGVEEDRKVTIFEGKRGDETYTLVDVSGTYYYNVGPTFRFEARFMPEMRMLAAVLSTEKGPYYIKLTGPEKIVSAAAGDFRTVFGANVSDEILLDEALQRRAAVVRVWLTLDGEPFVTKDLRVSLGNREGIFSADRAIFEVVEPGTHELRFDLIEGFNPIPARGIEVEHGKLVEVVVSLERGRY